MAVTTKEKRTFHFFKNITTLIFIMGLDPISTLGCMITHWIRLMLNYNLNILDHYDSLSYYGVWNLNLERILIDQYG